MLRIHNALCRTARSPRNWQVFPSSNPNLLRSRQSIPFSPRTYQWQGLRHNSTQPVKNPQNRIEVKRTKQNSKISGTDELPKPISSLSNAPLSSLLKDIYTVPNVLTMTRIAATPFIGYFLATGHSTMAISLFTYLCLTDFADGYIARRYNLKSVLGSILDPLADKFLMTTCTAALYIGGDMPLYIASIIIGRDVMLSFMAFYMRYKSLPQPRTVLRYFDPKITTHTVLPNMLGKVNTALQMFYIGGLVLVPGLEQILTLPFDTIFSWYGMVVAGSTVASGATYLFSRGSAKIPVK